MRAHFLARNSLLASTALAIACGLPMEAMAQQANETTGLEEIVVTAQKREQSIQDVPIAVTAVTAENLQANRIFTVNDLSAVAPGVTVKPSAGGISTPSFTIRGQVSYGVVAGSDKQVSIYVDGVYIGSPRGSIFSLPDIQRLEVLRGPQGTLFGRNATAGAVSITTRDPTGEAHAKLEGGIGNRGAYRLRATIDTPQIGPFSAYFSFVRDFRRGDIRNAAAGTVWDRTSSPSQFGKVTRSPRWLGTVDNESYFAAVKFDPSDSFRMVYKFDRNDDRGTPEGTSFLGWDRTYPAGTGLIGNFLTSLYTSNNTYIDTTGKRPDVVTNGWVTARDQRVQGHSLTATWNATDSITVKNVLAYRKAVVFAPSAIDGLSNLTFTAAEVPSYTAFLTFIAGLPPATASFVANSAVGNRALLIASQSSSITKQWSDELQVNYSSEKLQVTAGAIWFHSNDEAGGPNGEINTFSLTMTPPSGVVPLGNEGRYFNKATSLAAYAQIEYKILPELEFVAGARITRDKKTSAFQWDIRGVSQPTIVPPAYKKTKPNWLVGLNWKPTPDTLIYGKYSTSFVSGGSTAGIPYEPETASSFEVGAKADFFDHRLRTNLALFHVDYKHFQSPQSTTAVTSIATVLPILTQLYGAATAGALITPLSTFVIDQGNVRAKGVELEVTAAPTRGLTVGGSLSYTDVSFPFTNANVLAGNGGRLDVTQRPKWTASVYGSYETQPLFGETTLQFRADGLFRSRIRYAQDVDIYPDGSNRQIMFGKGYWLVNGRAALRHIQVGPAEAELAVWGKNIFNRKDFNFVLPTPLATSLNYVTARTYGVELSVDF